MEERSDNESIRILLLEDNAFDAELIAAQLASARLSFDVERVWTRDDFDGAVQRGSYDVILADHVLPGFDGDTALEIARERSPDVPFIFVSGTLTEELAVQALKRGARDYVVKQRLQRLPDAIRRAIAETEERVRLRSAELALRESQERLQLITDALPVLIALVGADHRYRFNNSAYTEWFGLSVAQLRGRHLRELAGEKAYAQIGPLFDRALKGERISFETVVPHHTLSHRHVHIDYVPERQPDGTITGCYALVHDISDRKAAEIALRELNESLETQVYERTMDLRQSEARLQAVFQSSFQHQSLLSLDGTLLHTNAASLEAILANEDDVCGQPFWDAPWFAATPNMPALIRLAVSRAAEGHASRNEIELDLVTGKRSFDFSLRPLRSHDGGLMAIVSEAVETTARRHAEDALRQAQKMEAVGQLTGGIAHDFNNILTVIGGNVDHAQMIAERSDLADPNIVRALDNAMKGVRRAAGLTQRLLAFSRRQPLQNQPTDMNGMITGMSEMLRRTLGEMVQLEILAAPDIWCVEVDPNQLEASILNLAVNARDAMPEGGKLVIEAGNAHLDDDYSRQHVEVLPGQYVVVRVTDNGHGMSDETVSRVFEPFFTTKEVGRGTGLGLSMVYGFIKQSGGHVQIQSRHGRGTTVSLFLPRSAMPLPHGKVAGAPVETQNATDEQTVLVAEDNDDVRAYTVECLRHLGYRVLEAHDGASALRLLERPDMPIQLLFSDMVMPGMSGRELAERAQAIQPGLRILFTSGYPRDNADPRNGAGRIAILAKPFTQTDLASAVRSALEKEASPARLHIVR